MRLRLNYPPGWVVSVNVIFVFPECFYYSGVWTSFWFWLCASPLTNCHSMVKYCNCMLFAKCLQKTPILILEPCLGESLDFVQHFSNSSRWPTAAKWAQGKHCGAHTVPALWFGWSRHQKQFQIPLECLFISPSVCYDSQTLSPVRFTFLKASPQSHSGDSVGIWIWVELDFFLLCSQLWLALSCSTLCLALF